MVLSLVGIYLIPPVRSFARPQGRLWWFEHSLFLYSDYVANQKEIRITLKATRTESMCVPHTKDKTDKLEA